MLKTEANAAVPSTILHVITGLEQGGAERTLFNLVSRSDRSRFHHIVAPLRDGGYWRAQMARAGVELAPLGWNRAWDAPAAYTRLTRLIRRTQPTIVQSWLYHADLAAAWATPREIPLIWTLRNSDPRVGGRYGALLQVLSSLSGRPALIVSNSERGLADHVALGYRPRRSAIVANGIDTELFRPGDRGVARAKLGLPTEGALIGMAARLDPFKDHAIFLRAVQIARAGGYEGRFVLAGAGVDTAPELAADGVIRLGAVADMPSFYAALDVATLSSSHGEGFPNAVAEAMACGAPVVATNVGDTATLLSQGGAILPPRDADALAQAWLRMMRLSETERSAIGLAGRARVSKSYSLPAMVAAYEALYEELGTSSNR